MTSAFCLYLGAEGSALGVPDMSAALGDGWVFVVGGCLGVLSPPPSPTKSARTAESVSRAKMTQISNGEESLDLGGPESTLSLGTASLAQGGWAQAFYG